MPYPYYNSYQQNYMGSYNQAYMQPPTQQQTYQSGIIWVENGYQEAANYPMAPNMAIPFWDRHADVIYLKQSDAAGRQTIRVLDYKDRTGQEQQPEAQPVTKGDLVEIIAEIRSLEALVKGEGGTENV